MICRTLTASGGVSARASSRDKTRQRSGQAWTKLDLLSRTVLGYHLGPKSQASHAIYNSTSDSDVRVLYSRGDAFLPKSQACKDVRSSEPPGRFRSGHRADFQNFLLLL